MNRGISLTLGLFMGLVAGAGAAFGQALEATCPSVSYRGPIIVATCYNAYMGLVRSSIDTRSCASPVGNVNGQLACNRGYGGGYGGGGYGAGGFGRPRYGY